MSNSPNLGIALLQQSQNSKYVTVNGAIDALDNAMNGKLAVAMADADQTLTAGQFAGAAVFECTGADTADRHLIVPNTLRVFLVNNKTTGGHNIIVETASPSGTVTVAAGTPQLVYCDASNNIVAVS
jgi:hypothetical protein